MLEKLEYFKVSLGQMITGVLINLVHSEAQGLKCCTVLAAPMIMSVCHCPLNIDANFSVLRNLYVHIERFLTINSTYRMNN